MLQLLMLSGACRPSFPIIWNKSLHGFGSFGAFGIGRRALTGRARLQRVQTPPRWQQPSHHGRCETLLQTRPCERARQLRQCGTLNHFEKEQAMDSFPGSGKAIFLLLRSPAHVDGRVAGKEYKSLWLESTDMKLKSGALQRTLLADVSRQKQSGAFLDKRLSSWRVANYLGAGKESRGTAVSAGSRAFPQDASSSVGRPHPTLDWTPRRSVSWPSSRVTGSLR